MKAKRWTCLLLPGLSCQLLMRQRPALRRSALVVVEDKGNVMRVRGVSPLAAEAGIRGGMLLASARSCCSGLRAITADALREREALQNVAQWCRWLGPKVALYAHNALVVETSGSSHLFDGEAPMLLTLLERLKRLGFQGRASVADTPRLAHALVLASVQRAVLSPPGGARSTSDPLPLEALCLDAGTQEALGALGITTVGELRKLPRDGLVARFGAGIGHTLAHLLGELEEEPVMLGRTTGMSEQIEFEDAVEDSQSILFTVKRLCDRIGERLLAEGCGAVALRLRLQHWDTTTTSLEIRSAQPLARAKALRLLLSTKLEGLELAAPVEVVELLVRERGPVATRYLSMFEAKRERNAEALLDLAGRLTMRLGSGGAVRLELRADYRPERAWQTLGLLEGTAKERPSDRPLPLRPLSLLPEPQPISVSLSPQGQVLLADARSVAYAKGPERLASAWWEKQSLQRDYYRLTLGDGEGWWVFRDAALGQWFRHGVFA